MDRFIKIEWSGFWDFPIGDYQSGVKSGQPMSGEFNKDHIILDQVSDIQYEIDPGKDTFPKSPNWDFTLINKDPNSGNELYPVEFLRNLGRPVDNGGHNSKFNDLFIRATIPILNDKIVFKGVVENFSYSLFERELRINCTDFIGSLKELDKKIFIPFTNEDLELEIENPSHEQIIGDFTIGLGSSIRDAVDKNLNIQKFIAKKPEVKYFSSKQVLGTFLPQTIIRLNLNRAPENGDWRLDTEANNLLKELFDRELTGMLRRMFLDNFDDNFWIKSATRISTSNGFRLDVSWRSSTRITFVQLGSHSILNPFFATMNARLFWRQPTTLPEEYFIKFDIQFPSMDNGNVETTFDDDKLVVFERGRYLKDENDPELSKYQSGDLISVTFHDYKVYDNDPDNFGVSVGWERFSSLLTSFVSNKFITVDNNPILCGVFFKNNAGVLKPDIEIGYFDNILSFMENIHPNLIAEFSFSGSSALIFNDSRLLEENNRHVFISDAMHYGWIGESIEDVTVNNARQLSAFVFSNEKGEIVYQSRLYHVFATRNQDGGFFVLDRQYAEPLTGKDFSFGDKFFKISFEDIIEINNLKSQAKNEKVFDVFGEVNFFVNPTNLAISNFRTSDLGSPDIKTLSRPLQSGSHTILRRPPGFSEQSPPERLFLKTAEQQAIDFARSVRFPTEVFDIGLDVLKNPDLNYDKIGIGDYLLIEFGEEELIYLVRKINYSPRDLLEKSISVRMTLLLVAITDEFLFEGSIEVLQGSGGDIDGSPAFASNSIMNAPSQTSDPCSGSGNNRVFLQWKDVQYCISIPSGQAKSTIATAIVGQINSNVPGLSAVNLGGDNPVIEYSSNINDSTDNGQSLIWLVPTAIEGNGAIFSPTSMVLNNGEDPVSFSSEPIDIFIDDILFGQSVNIDKNLSKEVVAQRILSGLNNIVQNDYTFVLTGSKIKIGSGKILEEEISVNVRNTGVGIVTENIIFKQTT